MNMFNFASLHAFQSPTDIHFVGSNKYHVIFFYIYLSMPIGEYMHQQTIPPLAQIMA